MIPNGVDFSMQHPLPDRYIRKRLMLGQQESMGFEFLQYAKRRVILKAV
jgi:hypothetical protein